MTASDVHDSELQFQTPPSDLRLVIWPPAVAPVRTLLLLAGTCALAAICGWLSQSPAMGLLTWLVLMIAMWRAWLPVTYQLGRNGVDLSVLSRNRHYDWWQFSDFETNEQTIVLKSKRADYRAPDGGDLCIHWANRRDEVVAAVGFYVGSRRVPQTSTVTQRQ
jgi:hypothetical protein